MARLGSLVGLAMPGSIPSTSGGSMGFPKYRLNRNKRGWTSAKSQTSQSPLRGAKVKNRENLISLHVYKCKELRNEAESELNYSPASLLSIDYPIVAPAAAVNDAVLPPSGRRWKRLLRRAPNVKECPVPSDNSPVDVICVSPAAVRVCVSVSSVDEGVFERPADVLRRQTGHGGHHVTGKLSDAQRPSVLTPPPVMLRPERTHSRHLRSTCS